MKKDNIKKNFIWNLIGLTSNCIVSLILLIIVKYVNGVNKAGIFTYAYSITILFYYISTFFNRAFQISNSNNYTFNSFFTARILSSIGSLLIIIIFCIISGFNNYKVSIIILLMCYKTLDSISDVFHGYLQNKDKLYIVGISYTIKSFFGILLFLISDILFKNIKLSIILLIAINLLVLLLFDILYFKKIYKQQVKLSIDKIITIYVKSFPIFIFQFLSIYLANHPKYIITYNSSNEVQTMFGILIMPATMVSLIGNYLINPYINKLNNLKNQNKLLDFRKLVYRLIFALFACGFLVLIISSIIGIPLLNFIYQINLNSYKIELLLIIFSAIFSSSAMVLSSVLTIVDKNKIQVYAYLFDSIVSTIFCYFITTNNSILGGTLSYLLSNVIIFMMFIIIESLTLKKMGD